MVEDAIEQLKPGLVIFDMIDNISFVGSKKDARTDQVLESMYQWARTLGVKYDFPVIACSQVSAEAELQSETQCYPAQHMLKDSKTGKQGAADLMIMIGKSADPACANKRYISTPKNKLAKGLVYLRNEMNFDGARARYNDPK
jgi:replicative DNA helicase